MVGQLKEKVEGSEAGRGDDMDVMSDSSGAPAPASKKSKMSFPGGSAGASAPSSSSAFPPRPAAVRARSTPGRGPQPPKDDENKKTTWALCATGFGRKVPRTLLELHYKEVLKIFPPDTAKDASFWSYPFATLYNIKFSNRENFLTALDHIKVRDEPFEWKDIIEDKTCKIYVRRDKPLAQIKIGRFNSHFHAAITEMFKDTTHAGKRLRFYNSELFVEIQGDIMKLLSLTEAQGDLKYEVTPHYDNFKKLGFELATVDTMVTLATAAARAQ